MNNIDFKEDIEQIKKDIKSLVVRLKNIKDKSESNIAEQLAELSSVISDFKSHHDKENSLLKWCSKCGFIISHPLKNIAYAFAAYAIFSILFKKNK